MAGLAGGAKRGAISSSAPIILLIFIGWILNDMVLCAPVAVIRRRDLGNEYGLVTSNSRDNPKTEHFSGRTDDIGPPVLQIPEILTNELIKEDGNKTEHNYNYFSQLERNGNNENHIPTIDLEYQPGLVLRCAAWGNPKPNVTWEYEDGNLPQYVAMTRLTYSFNQSEGRHEGEENLMWVDLKLPKLNNAFYGRLTCLVENQFGNATWSVRLTPNRNSSYLMKAVRCAIATVLVLVGVLAYKAVLWLDSKREERLYKKLPSQDLEIINKFKKGVPPPPPSPSSTIVPTTANCVAAAIEITITADEASNDAVKHGYRLVKQGSSSPDLEKRFLGVGNAKDGGISTPTSCASVQVLDCVNAWTNYVAYDDKLEISSQHFKIDLTKILENGAYGMVHEGQIRNDLTMKWSTVAVKMGKCERDDNFLLESVLTELKILASLPKAHEYIVNLRGAYTKLLHKRQAYVFVDFCENGNLAKFIDLNRNDFHDIFSEPMAPAELQDEVDRMQEEMNSNRSVKEEGIAVAPGGELEMDKEKKTFSTKELLSWAWQIADGMNFLHKNRIIHGNLCTANVYLTKNLKVKIGNIGYPSIEHSMECIDATSKKWLSVPNYNFEQFSKKSDLWDYGRLLWEVFSLREQQCPDNKEIQEFLESDDKEIEIPDFATPEMFEILLHCWNTDNTLCPEFDFFVKLFKHLHRIMFPAVNGPHAKKSDTSLPIL